MKQKTEEKGICCYCKKEFPSSKLYWVGMLVNMIIDENDEEVYTCKKCDKVFQENPNNE